jgi:hypothetical protein
MNRKKRRMLLILQANAKSIIRLAHRFFDSDSTRCATRSNSSSGRVLGARLPTGATHMTRNSIAIILASVIFLVGVGVWAQRRDPIIPTTEGRRPALGHETAVVSGEDIGVRLTGSLDADGRIQGTLVAKVNGKWVDVVGNSGNSGK